MAPKRVFFPWDRALLPQVADYLLPEQPGLVNLQHTAVMVPTRYAGERLLAALAHTAELRGSGLLSPRVLTPEEVLDWAPPPPDALSPGEAELAWTSVLLDLPLEDYRAIFPQDPVAKDFAWSLAVVPDLVRVQRELGEAGLDLSAAAQKLGSEHTEAARWEALVRLERLFENRLRQLNKCPLRATRTQQARTVEPPPGITRLIVACVTDPLPLALSALQKLVPLCRVEVLIYAPEALAEGFDTWGRPLTDFWKHRPINFPEPEKQLFLLGKSQAVAEQMATAISESTEVTALGATDAELAALLVNACAKREINVFDPSGVPFNQHFLAWLMQLVEDFLPNQPWGVFSQLLRLPWLHQALAAHVRRDLRLDATVAINLLRIADDFQMQCMPATVKAAMALIEHRLPQEKEDSADREHYLQLHSALACLAQWARRFQGEPLCQSLPEFLSFALADMRLHGASVEYRAFSQASEALLEALEQIESAATQIMPNLSPGERLRLLRRMLEGTRLFPEMTEAHALRLLGWLELLWEPAPALLIGGMNEGKVPESITADAWLPHSLRAALGLRTNDDRLARDAYLLTALQQSRMQPAGLRLYASRVSLANEPLKPSRLLLACTRVDLPARVAQLFPAQAEHLSEEGQSPIWQRGWKLLMPRFDDFPIPLKFSVTYFRNYLDCPFRYFLRHREKMEKQDLLDDEPDARSFGNFVHDALMLMAKDNSINRCDDVHKLADYLEDAVHDILKLRFGSQLSVPLLIHRQAAINRLRAAAAVHVESRRQGWHILSAESSLREELGRAWSLDAVEICGRIDLIEQHEGTGAWRILDYKTASRAKTPQDAHLADLGRNENLPDWRLHEGQKWIDLQLPLYVLAMREKLGPQGSAAYINLPAAVGAIRLEPWEALGSEKILTSAKNCACAVLRLIRERKFWPPSEKPSFDDYTGLYFKPEKLAEAFDYQAYPSDLGL